MDVTLSSKERFAFWIGVICASVIVKVLTMFSFIAQLLRSYGIWFLVYLELVRSCHCLLLGSLLAGKVVLIAIVMEIFGGSFLFVWYGVFGRREIVGVLQTLSVPCLISSFFFSEPYLTGSLCGETNLFLLFWIYLTFVIFIFDLFTPVYFLCTWVSLSFDINESLLLIKNYLQNTYYLFPSKDTTLDNGEQLSTYDCFDNDQTTLANKLGAPQLILT